MTEKARIYFDVDGVFNAVGRVVGGSEWDWYRRVRVNGYLITYAPDVVDLVNKLSATPGIGVYWLTTWCHDAPSKLAPAIGLNGSDWPVVGFEHWRRSIGLPWWKHLAIVEHTDGFEGPVLWIDDDHGVDPACMAWLAGQPQVLTLAPRTVDGVSRADAGVIEEFVSGAIS